MAIRLVLRGLDRATLAKVAEISGQNVYRCMQCGTCTGVCPMSDTMEITPRQAVALMQHGLIEPVKKSQTPWLCASCLACEVRCPRGIELPRVMEALRQLELRDNRDRLEPRKVPAETVAELPQIAMVAGLRKLTG